MPPPPCQLVVARGFLPTKNSLSTLRVIAVIMVLMHCAHCAGGINDGVIGSESFPDQPVVPEHAPYDERWQVLIKPARKNKIINPFRTAPLPFLQNLPVQQRLPIPVSRTRWHSGLDIPAASDHQKLQ